MYDNQTGTKETLASKHKDTRYHYLSFTIRTRQVVSLLIWKTFLPTRNLLFILTRLKSCYYYFYFNHYRLIKPLCFKFHFQFYQLIWQPTKRDSWSFVCSIQICFWLRFDGSIKILDTFHESLLSEAGRFSLDMPPLPEFSGLKH